MSHARQGDRGFSSEASILSPPWALADDHLIAAVGRLDLGVDVTPVEARSADGPVHGVAVVYVDEVVPPEAVELILLPGVGVGVETVEVAEGSYEIRLAVAYALLDDLPVGVAVAGVGVALLRRSAAGR